MSDPVIYAENLGKCYRIGERERYLALRDVLARTFSAPARLFRAHKPASPNGDATHIWALKNVSFEIRQGEVVGMIGRNGAGKTTLLKILARVTRPTEGRGQVRGRVGSLLEVGTGFHPELTGRENVYLSGAILGMRKKEIERKFDEMVAFAEVEKFIDTPLKHYSSGMQMRLAFAVAAHLDPEILLVDEVLAVGDAAFQKKCMGKMGDVAKQGRTVVFISHNMAAVKNLCSRGYLLIDGHIALSAGVSECIESYLASTADLPAGVETGRVARPPDIAADDTLRIQRVAIRAAGGRAILCAGEPLGLSMELEVFRHVEDLVFGFSIYSADGIHIVECRSTDTHGAIPHLEPGRYAIECLMQNPLNPGLYSLHVGARCAAKPLDHLPDITAFRVSPGERLASYWLQATIGLISLESEWTKPVLVEGRPDKTYGRSS